MNIPKTEAISLKSSNAALAFGCDGTGYGRFKADDVFDLEVRYIAYSKTLQGEVIILIFHIIYMSRFLWEPE